MFTVGIKFCGNCNPQINPKSLIQKIKERLPAIRFVGWEQEKDALLILNGCLVGCATRPAFEGPTVFVAGESVNGKGIETGALVDILCNHLEKLSA